MGPGRYLRTAWAGLPVWARWVLAGYIAGFTDGTAAHVRDLARGGFHAYSGFPYVPLRVFFISLVVLDPLVGHDPASLVRPEGLLILIVFGVFVLATAPALLRAMSRLHRMIT